MQKEGRSSARDFVTDVTDVTDVGKKEGRSSATDFVTDVTDVTDVGKKEEGRFFPLSLSANLPISQSPNLPLSLCRTLLPPFPLRSDFCRMPSIVVARDRTMEMWLLSRYRKRRDAENEGDFSPLDFSDPSGLESSYS